MPTSRPPPRFQRDVPELASLHTEVPRALHQRVRAYAEARRITIAEAVRRLVAAALERGEVG